MRTRSKRLTGLVAVAAAALLGISACGGGGGTSKQGDQNYGFADCEKNPNTCNSGPVKKGGEMVYAIEQVFTNWNITSDEGNAFAGSQTLAGIVPGTFFVEPDGTIELNKELMVSAELTNQTPQTIVYKIQPKAVWDDGTPIAVGDFDFAWKQQSGKKDHCQECVPASTSGYELIKSVVGSDNGKTVTVTFEDGKVYPEWKSLFGSLYPQHMGTKQGFDMGTPAGVGKAHLWFGTTVPTWSGGPYKISQYNKDQTVVQVPNPAYYAEKASLDKLVFKFVVEQAQLIPALKNREIHAAGPQPNADLVTQASQVQGVNYIISHGYQHEHIDLNLKNKYLADMELRKAIFTAINVKNIVDKTYGVFDKAAKPLGSHNFFPGDKDYKDVITPTGQGSGDTAKAKQILEAAGYKFDASGALLAKTGEKVPAFRFRHTKGNALRATTAELVQADLKKIGVDIKVEVTETLGATLSKADYDMIIFAWVGSPFYLGAAEQNWITDGGGNYGEYSNPEVDKLIKEAAGTLDPAKAAQLVNQADEIVAKEAYVLEIAQKPTLLFVYSDYANIRDNPSSSGVNYNNGRWGLKAA